jgi:hypothetical protein
MTWTYTPASLDITLSTGRLNAVRLLVGDTDSGDQQIQDEEVYFALAQSSDNIYNAAIFVCRLIASKYSRLVTTMADRGVATNYSDLIAHYNTLSIQLGNLAKKVSGKTLGIGVGGVLISDMYTNEVDTNRVAPEFAINQFDNPTSETSANSYPVGA